MNRPSPSRRRHLLTLALAYALASLFPGLHVALASDGEKTPPIGSPAPPTDQSDRAGASRTATDPPQRGTEKRFETHLTVIVTGKHPAGKHQLVAGAEVKMLSPSGMDAEPRTNDEGTVTFTLSGPASAKVRVIAEGWQSELVEAQLKEGKQQLNVQLTPLVQEKD